MTGLLIALGVILVGFFGGILFAIWKENHTRLLLRTNRNQDEYNYKGQNWAKEFINLLFDNYFNFENLPNEAPQYFGNWETEDTQDYVHLAQSGIFNILLRGEE